MASTAEQRTRTGARQMGPSPLIVATRHGTILALDAATGRLL